MDSLGFVNGFNSAPLPFKANFTPRASNIPDVLREAFNNAEKDVDVLMTAVRNEQIEKGLAKGDEA